jgi:hypothetical protein
MKREKLGRLEITNLYLRECQINLPHALRQIPRPVGKNNPWNQVSRHNVKGVLKGHLVARRNNEVTCPRHPTSEP